MYRRFDRPRLIAAFCIIACACSRDPKGPPPLDRKLAADLIARSDAFANALPNETRKIYKVTGIRTGVEGKTAEADFEWYYESGLLAQHDLKATAGFRLYDDGWRVDEDSLSRSLWGELVPPPRRTGAAAAPETTAESVERHEAPTIAEPTKLPAPDVAKAGDAFIGDLERLGAQSRELASTLRKEGALRYGVPDAVLNVFANELDLSAKAADDAIDCVKRGDAKGADLAFERCQAIFNRVKRDLADELQRGKERVQR